IKGLGLWTLQCPVTVTTMTKSRMVGSLVTVVTVTSQCIPHTKTTAVTRLMPDSRAGGRPRRVGNARVAADPRMGPNMTTAICAVRRVSTATWSTPGTDTEDSHERDGS